MDPLVDPSMVMGSSGRGGVVVAMVIPADTGDPPDPFARSPCFTNRSIVAWFWALFMALETAPRWSLTRAEFGDVCNPNPR